MKEKEQSDAQTWKCSQRLLAGWDNSLHSSNLSSSTSSRSASCFLHIFSLACCRDLELGGAISSPYAIILPNLTLSFSVLATAKCHTYIYVKESSAWSQSKTKYPQLADSLPQKCMFKELKPVWLSKAAYQFIDMINPVTFQYGENCAHVSCASSGQQYCRNCALYFKGSAKRFAAQGHLLRPPTI